MLKAPTTKIVGAFLLTLCRIPSFLTLKILDHLSHCRDQIAVSVKTENNWGWWNFHLLNVDQNADAALCCDFSDLIGKTYKTAWE